jgi:hypothetical protein
LGSLQLALKENHSPAAVAPLVQLSALTALDVYNIGAGAATIAGDVAQPTVPDFLHLTALTALTALTMLELHDLGPGQGHDEVLYNKVSALSIMARAVHVTPYSFIHSCYTCGRSSYKQRLPIPDAANSPN